MPLLNPTIRVSVVLRPQPIAVLLESPHALASKNKRLFPQIATMELCPLPIVRSWEIRVHAPVQVVHVLSQSRLIGQTLFPQISTGNLRTPGPALSFKNLPPVISLRLLPLDAVLPKRAPVIGGTTLYGTGHRLRTDCYGGVHGGVRFLCTGGIAANAVDPPSAPLCVHMGQGVILFGWTLSSFYDPSALRFEIAASESLNATYFSIVSNQPGNRAIFRGVPMGITAYFRIRTVLPSGFHSEWAQFKLGKIINNQYLMKIQAPRNSHITQGARFPIPDPATGTLITFQALHPITIS